MRIVCWNTPFYVRVRHLVDREIVSGSDRRESRLVLGAGEIRGRR